MRNRDRKHRKRVRDCSSYSTTRHSIGPQSDCNNPNLIPNFMKQEIIEKMTEIVEKMMTTFKSDFYEHDLKELADYEGEFIWQVHASHTYLHRISEDYLDSLLDNEPVLYAYCQGCTWVEACLDSNWKDEVVYHYDGERLMPMPREMAKSLWGAVKEQALKRYIERTGNELPTDFKVRIEFRTPDTRKYFIEQVNYATQHNDNSLMDCLKRFRNYMKKTKGHKIVICRDFSDRSFTFYEDFGNDHYGMNGGIIFHGYPEEGYKENCSVQLTPSYGWSIHT